MFYDKLSFRFNRCDYDFPIYKLKESKESLFSSSIIQILKRPYLILKMLRESALLILTLTPIKKAKKPRKKRKKGKGARIIEKPLNESKPLFITMISAAVYRSLT
jgi:hypothetical protein